MARVWVRVLGGRLMVLAIARVVQLVLVLVLELRQTPMASIEIPPSGPS